MNDFDSMIEKYRRELVEAKSKSILSEIENAEEDVENADEESIDFFDNNTTDNDFSDPLLFTDESFDDNNVTIENEVTDDILDEIPDDFSEIINGENDNDNSDRISDFISPFDESNNIPFAPDTGFGTLRVQVFAADRVYPVSSAFVTVTENEGVGKGTLFQGYTDTSGILDNIRLPAPSKEMSGSPSRLKPYSQFDIVVSHPNFQTRRYVGIPIFEGIKSIQNVQLVPKENGSDENATTTVESEPNDLLLERNGIADA